MATTTFTNGVTLTDADWFNDVDALIYDVFNEKTTAGTSGTILRSNGTNIVNTTATYPDTVTANHVLYATATNAIGGSANLTFNGTTLTAAGLSGPHNGTVGATTPADGTFTTLAASGNTTLTGDLAVNGGDLTTSATTFNLLNATATTVNFAGGASTALNIGHASATALFACRVQAHTGTAALPGVATGAADRGMYSNGATHLGLSSGGSASEITMSAGLVGINQPSPTARLHVVESGARIASIAVHSAADRNIGYDYSNNSAYASSIRQIATDTAAGTGFKFWDCVADVDGTPDTEAYMRGDGQGFQDAGTAWSTPADYAEFMESLDGQEIPVGKSVVLESGKVRPAEATDNPDDVIGVIRPRSGSGSIVANAGDLRWHGKYLKDEDGDYILEDYKVFDWDETLEDGSVVHHNKADYKMPKGVTPPPYAKVTVCKKRKLNPAFDPAQKFIPRRNRPEWNLVGMVGQVPIEKGQPVNPRWRKMFDLSATREQWFIR